MAIKHSMSAHQMLDQVFDYTNGAIKTITQDTTHSLNLSASSDSIVAVHPQQSVAQGVKVDCQLFRRVALFVQPGTFTLQVAATAGGTLQTIKTGLDSSITPMYIIDIIATEIKLTAPSGSYMILQG